jgi:serine protease Do
MNPVLEAIQEAVAGVAERVGPAVVGLGRGWSRGSGVVFESGRVLTAAHVLRGDELTVTFADGRSATGKVLGADADLDVAVVEVDTAEIAPVEWDVDAVAQLSTGAPVLALANPGGHGLRTTFGLASATGRSFRGPRGRRIPGSIEHTAPLPRGSSGGPLVDPDGRLLGLNAIRREGGLILAVPADTGLRRRVDALARGEGAERPRLGVALAHPRAARKLRAAVGLPERDGLLVRGVVDDSPAARAGIERGDLLVAAAGKPLSGVDDLFDALEAGAASLTLGVVRGAEERDVEVHFSS